MIACSLVSQLPPQTRYHRCPRCGSRLARDERTGITGWLAGVFFLRGLSCKPDCGWRGFRFSRSLFRRRKRRLRSALFVVLFIAMAALTVRYVLSRAGAGPGGTHDDGFREVE
jgi:hypothetical protein